MAQPASERDATILGVEVFWPSSASNSPTRWKDWLTEYHMAALANDGLLYDNLVATEALTPASTEETNAQRTTQETINTNIRDTAMADDDDTKASILLFCALGRKGRHQFALRSPRTDVKRIRCQTSLKSSINPGKRPTNIFSYSTELITRENLLKITILH